MKEFQTAVNDAYQDPDSPGGWELKVDDREMRFYKPTDAQFAMYMAATGKFASDSQRMAAMIDLFVNVFEEEDRAYIIDRMMDRSAPMPLATVTEMLEYMIEEWTGRPTRPSSASTRSRASGGRKSTRVIQGSTLSDSQATGS